MKATLKLKISELIANKTQLNVTDVLSLIEKPKKKEFGEFSFPCFTLAQSKGLAPNVIAKLLASELIAPDEVDSITAAGPFVNFKLKRGKFTAKLISQIVSSNLYQEIDLQKNAAQTVLLEYSSPNIAKPFHVGHLRATLLGNSLDKIYRRLGYKVISVNHLGDWGTQFGFVWAGCKLWGKPENPHVKTLVELYKKATALKEKQEKEGYQNITVEEDVNQLARNFFLDLENGESYAVEFWKWCLEISLSYLKTTYQRLGISFDHYLGESFYSDKMDLVKKELEDKSLLQESQGAYGVDLGESLGFARILTPDGRSLYLTRDIAAAIYRHSTFKFDSSLYVVGAPQSLHFKQLIQILKSLGYSFAENIKHVEFGHVLGMKTRGEGEIVELNDFLNEAYELALKAYREQVTKRPEGLDEQEVANSVSLAAIMFSTLSRTRHKDVQFSWENALAFQGDSGPYLLYAYARINGIKEKAIEHGLTLNSNHQDSLFEEEVSFQLANLIDDYLDILAAAIKDNDPCTLAGYAIELSQVFSRAYNELKVVGEAKELAEARLALFEAARIILKEAIELLGMKTLERM